MADIRARTQVTRIAFSTEASRRGRCKGDIRGGSLDLNFKLRGSDPVSIRTRPPGI